MLVDYNGKKVEGTSIDFDVKKEEWNEYEFDGSRVRARAVVTRVVKLDNEKNQNGDPVYLFWHNFIIGDVTIKH